MTQLILKSELDKDKLEALLHFLKSWDVEVEVTPDDIIEPESKSDYKPFSKTLGMWKDRDIDARQLRREAWGGNKSLSK
jgi:hypothetical protein